MDRLDGMPMKFIRLITVLHTCTKKKCDYLDALALKVWFNHVRLSSKWECSRNHIIIYYSLQYYTLKMWHMSSTHSDHPRGSLCKSKILYHSFLLPTDRFHNGGLSITRACLYGTSCLHFTASQFWEEPPYWILHIRTWYTLCLFMLVDKYSVTKCLWCLLTW